ncbi:MAG: hypothetical protein ACI97A_003116 [Planctomycetota bacterium]|jgi:hypothetical protein
MCDDTAHPKLRKPLRIDAGLRVMTHAISGIPECRNHGHDFILDVSKSA